MGEAILITAFLLFLAFIEALLLGQLIGWWARRQGAAYVIKHLGITKP